MRTFLALLILVNLLSSIAWGGDLPVRPESRILDETRLLDAGEQAKLSALWKDLAAKGHGDVYLYTASYKPINWEAVVNSLREWPQGGGGVVIVFTRADHAWYVFTNQAINAELNSADIDELYRKHLFPLRGDETPSSTKATEALVNATTYLESRMIEISKHGNLFEPKNLAMAGVILLAGGFIFLVATLIARRGERKYIRQGRFYYFPPVRIGYRLGGPFSGGTVLEAKFEEELRIEK